MCVNQLIIDSQIFIQHAVSKQLMSADTVGMHLGHTQPVPPLPHDVHSM